MNKITLKTCLLLNCLFFFTIFLYAKEDKEIVIQIKDSVSHSTLPNGALTVLSNSKVYLFNEKGILKIKSTIGDVRINHIGYYDKEINLNSNNDTIILFLNPKEAALKEVIIKNSRYRNRGNPAVELIKNVVKNREKNQPHNKHNSISFQKYEKFNNGFMTEKGVIPRVPLLKKLDPIFQNFDTTNIKDFQLTPILLSEDVFRTYRQNTPFKENTIHLGNKEIRFDDRYINIKHSTEALKFIYDGLDIYDAEIQLFSRKILSPISGLGPQFYKYYIVDTLYKETANPIIHVEFEPRTAKAVLFRGDLKIQLKDYAIKDAEIFITKEANLNFIEEAKINIYYQNAEEENYIEEEYSFTKASIMPQSGLNIYIERAVYFDKMQFNKNIDDSLFNVKIDPKTVIKDFDKDFWEEHRPVPLTEAEEKQYETFDSLNKTKFFKTLQDLGSFLFTGYKQVGSWEIGTLHNFFAYNSVEGVKLRLGARSTPRFSKSLYFSGYFGYGFKDENTNYGLQMIKSFSKKESVFAFPYNYLSLSHYKDIRFPGQDMQVLAQANLLANIRTTEANRILYNQRTTLQYVRDWNASLQTQIGLQYKNEKPGGILLSDSLSTRPLNAYQNLSALLYFTWAPKQEIIQQKEKRNVLPNEYPVLRGEIEWAPQNISLNTYSFLRWNLSLFKRTYLGPFGKIETRVNYGKTHGTIPYTLLYTPNTNTSYFLDKNAFNLLNYSEIVADEVFQFYNEWQLDGLILNRIPLIKHLNFREVVAFQMLTGNLSNKNNPFHNTEIPDMPKDEEGNYFINTMKWNNPYMEINFGITNILKVIRVDYVMRLSHKNTDKKLNGGLKISVHFSL